MAMGILTPRLGIDTIPNFLTARSPQGLRRIMLRNNAKQKGYVEYHHIQERTDGTWIVWFDVKESLEGLEKILGGNDG